MSPLLQVHGHLTSSDLDCFYSSPTPSIPALASPLMHSPSQCFAPSLLHKLLCHCWDLFLPLHACVLPAGLSMFVWTLCM